jgi:hypothetical protein
MDADYSSNMHWFQAVCKSLLKTYDMGNKQLIYYFFHFTSVTRSKTVGRTPSTCDQLVARPPLPVYKHRKTHTQHKH